MAAIGKEQGVGEVWRLSLSLGVDTYEAELLPDSFKQDINSKVHMDRNADVLTVKH